MASAPRAEGPLPPQSGAAPASHHKKKNVRSTRLSSEAQIRNRLFPKTRSWFALDAPLELLSPLSVIRIIFAFNVVTWTLATVLLRDHSVRILAVAIGIGTALLAWLALELVHRLETRWVFILLAISTAQIALLTWAAAGTAVTYVYALSAIPVGIAAALFLPFRALLVQQLLAFVGLLLGLVAALGYLTSAVVSVSIALVNVATSFTVYFLTRASQRQRSFDNDTGLPNGVGLSARVEATARRPSFVVAVIRLEGIADAREALGYEVGTELLKRAVEDLGQVLPPTTFIGRVDGDELVVTLGIGQGDLAHGTRAQDDAQAIELARTLAGAMNAGRYLVDDIEVSLRAHIGLAIAPWDGSEVPELVRRASLSAGRAATQGLVFFLWDGDFGAMTASDLGLLADLRLAIDRDELSLAYQPQITTASARLASVEALLRWHSPTHGNVSPSRFIPLAERTGLIGRLTDWVLGEALEAQVRWRSVGLDIPVGVNLSPTTINTPDLPDRILDELARRRLPATCLTIEVTETAAIDLLQAVSLLRPLHDAGIRISIDDFGTGYTSLTALPDLPLDELKVDQSFVMRSLTSTADDAIVRTVRELALRLGLDAVAEGVETKDMFDRMCSYGFDLLQGYFLSKPLEEADLIEYASRRDDNEHSFDPLGASAVSPPGA
jgi:EAL domain-containing protein (putative c-di-GMP-specific phosphodiesterase class I)/GGDEF domain-containing protein